jgi:hypothetical protein
MSDPEQGNVIAMTQSRDKAAAINAVLLLDPGVRAAVETVAMDCHWPFRHAVEFVLPHARIVADKFHVLRCVDQAAQRIRVRVGRLPSEAWTGRHGLLARQNHPRSVTEVFRGRWVFMKREEKLSADESSWLESIFDHSHELRLAWLMKEQFARIYCSKSRADAEIRLQIWLDHVKQWRIQEFERVWRTLEHWREPILAYFEPDNQRLRRGDHQQDQSHEADVVRIPQRLALPAKGSANVGSPTKPRVSPPEFVKSPKTRCTRASVEIPFIAFVLLLPRGGEDTPAVAQSSTPPINSRAVRLAFPFESPTPLADLPSPESVVMESPSPGDADQSGA